jgi:aminoacyl tRNA synthase complex-interacting multifunctional protein 1
MEKVEGPEAPEAAPGGFSDDLFVQIDLRVGELAEVWKHP